MHRALNWVRGSGKGSFGVGLALAIAAVGAARAADLPTEKEVPPPPAVNCFASFWTWLDSTAADCPLSYGGFTVYGILDWGVGYESNGADYNAAYTNNVENIISKVSNGAKWVQTPNGLSQSFVGIKMNESIGWGWSIIGAVETGFTPYYGYLSDAERSLVQNNGKALSLQNANGDSSRSGQWDNGQGFIGVRNETYGTLTVGRVNTLSLDGLIAYDPMGAAYAFSPFGFTGSFAGFGDTEAARVNTAVEYRLDFMSFRGAGLVQWGGYDQGNATTAMYQGQIGADFANVFGGTLSLDGFGSYAKNAVAPSTFTGTCAVLTSGPFAGQTGCSDGVPLFYNNTDLKATLSNNSGAMALAKYTRGPLTLSGGYAFLRQADPSSTYSNGFKTIGGPSPRPFRTRQNCFRPSGSPMTPTSITGLLPSSFSAPNMPSPLSSM
jgi:predicted porin